MTDSPNIYLERPYTEEEYEIFTEGYKAALKWVIGEVLLSPSDQDRLWKVIDGG